MFFLEKFCFCTYLTHIFFCFSHFLPYGLLFYYIFQNSRFSFRISLFILDFLFIISSFFGDNSIRCCACPFFICICIFTVFIFHFSHVAYCVVILSFSILIFNLTFIFPNTALGLIVYLPIDRFSQR
jgi:hypothetical protein